MNMHMHMHMHIHMHMYTAHKHAVTHSQRGLTATSTRGTAVLIAM